MLRKYIGTGNTNVKFQRNIFVFGCAFAQKKTGKGEDVTFMKRIFGYF